MPLDPATMAMQLQQMEQPQPVSSRPAVQNQPQLTLDQLNQIILLQQQHGLSDAQLINLLSQARGR